MWMLELAVVLAAIVLGTRLGGVAIGYTGGLGVLVLTLGLPDVFSEHGDPGKLLALQGLDAAGIEQSVRARFLAGVLAG